MLKNGCYKNKNTQTELPFRLERNERGNKKKEEEKGAFFRTIFLLDFVFVGLKKFSFSHEQKERGVFFSELGKEKKLWKKKYGSLDTIPRTLSPCGRIEHQISSTQTLT